MNNGIQVCYTHRSTVFSAGFLSRLQLAEQYCHSYLKGRHFGQQLNKTGCWLGSRIVNFDSLPNERSTECRSLSVSGFEASLSWGVHWLSSKGSHSSVKSLNRLCTWIEQLTLVLNGQSTECLSLARQTWACHCVNMPSITRPAGHAERARVNSEVFKTPAPTLPAWQTSLSTHVSIKLHLVVASFPGFWHIRVCSFGKAMRFLKKGDQVMYHIIGVE